MNCARTLKPLLFSLALVTAISTVASASTKSGGMSPKSTKTTMSAQPTKTTPNTTKPQTTISTMGEVTSYQNNTLELKLADGTTQSFTISPKSASQLKLKSGDKVKVVSSVNQPNTALKVTHVKMTAQTPTSHPKSVK